MKNEFSRFSLTQRMRLGVLVAVMFGLISLTTVRAQSLLDLGDFGGGFSAAIGINNSGQVVGESHTSSGTGNAFLYSDGMMNLGTFGGAYSEATGINNSGQVVGYADTSSGTAYPFLYSNGTMTNLGPLPDQPVNPASTTYNSGATGINDSGQIVANSNSDHANNAFIYSNGTWTSLGSLSTNPNYTYTYASGINNSGQVVGYSDTSSGTYAFLYSNGTMTNLGTAPGSNYSVAEAVNNSGQVVGYAGTGSASTYAFLYSNKTWTNLGTLPGWNSSVAYGINDSGQIVGSSLNGPPGLNNSGSEAFLYSSSGGMKDLNVLYASLLVSGTGSQAGFKYLLNANAINDSGEIVGDGAYWNGTTLEDEAFLLNPTGISPSPTPDPSSAPEPPSWLLGLVSLGGFAFLRRRAALTSWLFQRCQPRCPWGPDLKDEAKAGLN